MRCANCDEESDYIVNGFSMCQKCKNLTLRIMR